MIVERVIEVRIARADPPRGERWISVTRAGGQAQPARLAEQPVATPARAAAVPLSTVVPPVSGAGPAARSVRRPATHLIRIMLTPSERALLGRLHRCMNEREKSPVESVAEAAQSAIACCADWPDSWRADNAKIMRRYRKDWAREAQTVPLAVELGEQSAKALRRLAAEMGWLLEDAARFAIRNLYDAYEDNFGLAEGPVSAPAMEITPTPVPQLAPPSPHVADAAHRSAPPPAPLADPPAAEVAPVAPAMVAPASERRDGQMRGPETPATPTAKPPAPVKQPAPERERRATKARPATHEASPKPRITHKDIAGDREVEFIRRYQAGDRRAGDVLLQAHERLILKMAMKCRGRGLDDDDLIQWARMGFLHAASKWSESAGAKLATYGVIWMKQHLQRAIDDEGSDIRVPVHMRQRIRMERREDGGMSDKAAAAYLLLDPRRLDAPVPGHEDDGSLLGDMTAGADAGPEDALVDEDAQARRREPIGRAMTWLTPQEQEVVRRMVLADDPETLEDVGASFDRTRERIRQIKVKALEKLERALRKLAADDDAVLWGAEPPDGPVRRRLSPQPPPTQPPAADVAAPTPEPRAKPIQRPAPATHRPTVEQIASFRPLKPPSRKLDDAAASPAPRSAQANRALWELA